MRPNRTKELLRQGEVALGTGFGQLRSPEIPKLLSAAGFDWTFIDCEHGCFDVETIQDLVRTSLLTPLTPVVRVADLQYSLVARALDMGAEGVIFPRVEEPERLAQAVSWARFPPDGIRGFGLGAPQVGYQNHTFEEIIRHLNAHVLVVLQVETRTALERVDDLLAVKGVDAVMVGPADLSISLGVPGQFDHPKMVEAITRIVESCRRHGVYPGMQTRTMALARFWKQRGMQFLGCGNELGFLWDKARETVQQLRAEG